MLSTHVLATATGPHIYWLTSRAAGIAALLLSSLSVCVGLLMGGRLLKGRGPDLRATHEALSLATLGALLVHGLALLGDDREHIEQAHLYQEMGRQAFRSGDSQRAVEWAEQARLHAERLAADPALDAEGRAEAQGAAAQSHNTLGVAFARLGRLEEAVGHIERSVALARDNGLLQAACRGLANLSVLYSTLDPARAIETRNLKSSTKMPPPSGRASLPVTCMVGGLCRRSPAAV